MKINPRKYNHEQDFCSIRDFLVQTYNQFNKPTNWTLDHWNYARYFVMPMIGAYGTNPVSIEDSLKAVQFWEDHTWVWETAERTIAGVIALEYPWPGAVFFLRGAVYDHILDEMFDKSEETLVHPDAGTLKVFIYDHDTEFQSIATERGYKKLDDWPEEITEYVIEGEPPQLEVPPGFMIQSMGDDNDLDRRRKAFGLGFNHEDPNEWPSLYSYQELQRAPDYRRELDLYVVAPDGEFVSFCCVWWDRVNRIATLEPVGTAPKYRRMGLAREVVYEGIRRAAALGAEKILVGSGQEFYLSIGFKKIASGHNWMKKFG